MTTRLGRAPMRALLPRGGEREFAVADAPAEAFGVAGGRVLAVGRDELGKRGEQAGLRQAVAVDPVEAGLRPGFRQIAERSAFFVGVIEPRLRHWTRDHAHVATPDWRARAAVPATGPRYHAAGGRKGAALIKVNAGSQLA